MSEPGPAGQPPRRRPFVRAWAMYSWANHGWETVIATVLAGPWLLALATDGRDGHATLLSLAGLHLRAESWPSLVVTVGALAQLAVLPPLGAAADRAARRIRWLVVTCVLGGLAAIALAATAGDDWLAAGVIVVLGTVAYGASNVLYNSLLTDLADPGERDAVSSSGFAYGYLGGGLLLVVDLALLLAHGPLGIGKATAVRVCFGTAAVWWVGFGLAALARLRDLPQRAAPESTRLLTELRRILRLRQTRRFLAAYLLFSDGVSAVIGLASIFITHELYGDSASRASTFLFALILVIQFVAVGGALAFGRLAARTGAKRAILLSLVIWCLVVAYAYLGLHDPAEAVVAGLVIGVVLGGSQALARSLWSQLVPPGRESTYFGLYEVANEGTSWIAPLLFTIVVNVTGSYRQAILSLLVLFVVGGFLLAVTDVDAAVAETAAEPS